MRMRTGTLAPITVGLAIIVGAACNDKADSVHGNDKADSVHGKEVYSQIRERWQAIRGANPR